MSLLMPETPSNPELVIEEIANRLRRHALLLHKVENDPRIEIAAALAHGQAIKRRKPHGRRDAFAVEHRAHAGAIAEMGNHDAPVSSGWPDHIRQDARDVFVREAVKAVAPHSFLREAARQGEDAGDFRLRVMKRRIEARDLRQRWVQFRESRDSRKMMRLMQGRKRNKTPQLSDHAFIDADWSGIDRSAMDDAMTCRDQRVLRKGTFEPAKKSRKRILVGCALRQALVDENTAITVFRCKVHLLADAVALALTDEILPRGLYVTREKRELDAR